MQKRLIVPGPDARIERAGTVRHNHVLPMVTESHKPPVTLAPQFCLTSEKLSDTQPQRETAVNAEQGCWVTARRSDSITTQIITIDMARARQGAVEAARIIRAARHRDLLAAVEEWRRASGDDRRYWRQDALHRLQEWHRLYVGWRAAA